MKRAKIVVAVIVLLLGASPRGFASQSDIDAIVAQVAAGFHQTFDGKSLRPWQESYQAACVTGVPRLARLLQEEGVELTHNPYAEHRDLLRRTLPQMQDKHMQAMDLHVQTSQQMLATKDTAQANALRAQMSEQEKTVKLYDSIVATLQERVAYLDKCVPYAEKAFADAAKARPSLAAKPNAKPPSPGVHPDSGLSVAMPTGVPPHIDYDPKKGISIGCIGDPGGCPSNVPPAPPPASSSVSGAVSAAAVDADLRQAAQACKNRYEEAFERLKQKRRAKVEQARQEIPKLEACIRDKIQEENYWQQRRKEPAWTEQLEEMRQERDRLRTKIDSMETQAAKNDAYRKWEEASREVTRLEQEISKQEARRLQLIDETIVKAKAQRYVCEHQLQLKREEITAAEKAVGGSLERAIAALRQKRFADIESLVASRDLSALRRCAAQGYLQLEDWMRELER